MEYLTDWTDRDRKLAEALLIHEAQMHSCGHSLERSTHPDMEGWFALAGKDEDAGPAVVCYACAAIERAQRQMRKDNVDPTPGMLMRVVDTRPASKPLPPRQGSMTSAVPGKSASAIVSDVQSSTVAE